MLADPKSYESIDPGGFRRDARNRHRHRLTGWNAVRSRAHALGLELDDAAIQAITRTIKERADIQPMSLDEVDALLRESAVEKI